MAGQESQFFQHPPDKIIQDFKIATKASLNGNFNELEKAVVTIHSNKNEVRKLLEVIAAFHKKKLDYYFLFFEQYALKNLFNVPANLVLEQSSEVEQSIEDPQNKVHELRSRIENAVQMKRLCDTENQLLDSDINAYSKLAPTIHKIASEFDANKEESLISMSESLRNELVNLTFELHDMKQAMSNVGTSPK